MQPGHLFPAVIRRRTQPLGRLNAASRGLDGQHLARVDQLAIQQHRARAAVAGIAAIFHAEEAGLAQSVQQGSLRLYLEDNVLTVDAQLNLHGGPPHRQPAVRRRPAAPAPAAWPGDSPRWRGHRRARLSSRQHCRSSRRRRPAIPPAESAAFRQSASGCPVAPAATITRVSRPSSGTAPTATQSSGASAGVRAISAMPTQRPASKVSARISAMSGRDSHGSGQIVGQGDRPAVGRHFDLAVERQQTGEQGARVAHGDRSAQALRAGGCGSKPGAQPPGAVPKGKPSAAASASSVAVAPRRQPCPVRVISSRPRSARSTRASYPGSPCRIWVPPAKGRVSGCGRANSARAASKVGGR